MRVIAGSLGSRRLLPPPRGVRPTADRVREALFARQGDLHGAQVLDLFAGTGALGIEALSRGAERAVFVERAGSCLQVLRRNLHALGLEDRSRVLGMDAVRALRVLAAEPVRFDLVLLDPPYAGDWHAQALEALREYGLLAAHGEVVAEASKRHAVPPLAGFVRDAERAYGDTVLTWLRIEQADGASVQEQTRADARHTEEAAGGADGD